jgi:phosphosulfolactate phosphohydrolase-like enzyme
VGAFLNLKATADFLARTAPERLLLICSGTFEQASYEDALGAGALCDLLWSAYAGDAAADSAKVARELFRAAQTNLPEAAAGSRNGRRLQAIPDLRDDVAFCTQHDVFGFAAGLQALGAIQKM